MPRRDRTDRLISGTPRTPERARRGGPTAPGGPGGAFRKARSGDDAKRNVSADPRRQARPRAPLGAGESRRQASLALVAGDRPPEDRKDHDRRRHRGPPCMPEGPPPRLRYRGRRRRARSCSGTPTCRQSRSTPPLRASRRAISGQDVGKRGEFGRIRRLKAPGEGP